MKWHTGIFDAIIGKRLCAKANQIRVLNTNSSYFRVYLKDNDKVWVLDNNRTGTASCEIKEGFCLDWEDIRNYEEILVSEFVIHKSPDEGLKCAHISVEGNKQKNERLDKNNSKVQYCEIVGAPSLAFNSKSISLCGVYKMTDRVRYKIA